MISDYRINTKKNGDQTSEEGGVVLLTNGSFVTLYINQNTEVYAQRYGANGEKLAGEILIDSFGSPYDELEAKIVALDDGGFVSLLEGERYDEGESVAIISAQRFDANGAAVGNKIDFSDKDGVAVFKDGSFLASWWETETNQRVQRFDSTGAAQGIGINLPTTYDLDIAALNDKKFVLTWTDYGDTSSSVHAQVYSANDTTVGAQIHLPSEAYVYALKDGGFYVQWESQDFEHSFTNMYMQRYSANGVAQGNAFLASPNEEAFLWESDFTFAELADGGFVTAWVSVESDIYAQRFNASGETQGNTFRVNTHTENYQETISVIGLQDGGFLITWVSDGGQDGDGKGVYGKRYDASGNEIEWYDFSSTSDRLFNWAESTFTDLFPNHATSQEIEGYHARLYENNNALGEQNGNLYFYDGHSIILVGTVDDFLSAAIAAGF